MTTARECAGLILRENYANLKAAKAIQDYGDARVAEACRERKLSVGEWVEAAPPGIAEELRSVTVMNFLRSHCNFRFQMLGRYDGAMSEECKALCRKAYEAIDQLVRALESKESQWPTKPPKRHGRLRWLLLKILSWK